MQGELKTPIPSSPFVSVSSVPLRFKFFCSFQSKSMSLPSRSRLWGIGPEKSDGMLESRRPPVYSAKKQTNLKRGERRDRGDKSGPRFSSASSALSAFQIRLLFLKRGSC